MPMLASSIAQPANAANRMVDMRRPESEFETTSCMVCTLKMGCSLSTSATRRLTAAARVAGSEAERITNAIALTGI